MRGALSRDLAYAVRLLRRQPLPTLVAALCLALGIGATTTMFSIGDALLRRPLPFPLGDRLVAVSSPTDANQAGAPSSYLDLLDWRSRTHAFAALGAIGGWNFVVQGSEPLLIRGGLITSGFFETLGATPEFGRLFAPDEDQPGGALVTVMSHGLAQRLFGAARGALDQVVSVSGEPRTVVGIIPDRWRFPSRADVWVPVAHLDGRNARGTRNLQVVAALRPGVALQDAQSDLRAIGRQLANEYPATNAQIRPAVRPLREAYVGSARAPLRALSLATLLVLLVACANAAGLQVARAAYRSREIAMRVALGAGRGRIRRQLVTESVMLALVACAMGVVLAVWGSSAVGRAVAVGAPTWMTFGLNGKALAFAVTVSILVGITFGVAPASRLARMDPAAVLHGGERSLGGRRANLQRALVVCEVALSLVLLVGAGLAILSVYRLERVPLGFDATGVLTFRVSLQGQQYSDPARRARASAELVRRLATIPGVESAAGVALPPVANCCARFAIQVEGHPTEPGHEPVVLGNMITPGYFGTMRIPVVSGRDFRDGDGHDAPRVAIVSQTFARTYWPGGDPLGHRLRTRDQWATIVGVVRDVREQLEDAPEAQVYYPHQQDPWDAMNYVVRTTMGDPMSLVPAIRRALFDLDPTTPAYGEITMERAIDALVAPPRTLRSLIAGFALIALVLATAGMYAVMAFFVSQRTRELGLRMALGAAPAGVLTMVLRQAAALCSMGVVIGLVGSWFAARLLARGFYGVTPGEPLLYAAPAALLVGAGLAATYAPAWHASRVDPMEALRAE